VFLASDHLMHREQKIRRFLASDPSVARSITALAAPSNIVSANEISSPTSRVDFVNDVRVLNVYPSFQEKTPSHET
jgi:hypothetical protein